MRLLIGLLTAAVLFAAPVGARASDHNNVDAGRPLSFDDAETVAFGERDFEYGLSLRFPRRGGGGTSRAGLGFAAEYLNGFALNSQLSVGVDAEAGGRAGSERTGFDLAGVGVGWMHNFNREIGRAPALSLRADLLVPTERGEQGRSALRLRGIASRTARQYDRFHLNLDATLVLRPTAGERTLRPAVTLGYTVPLGYPARFDRTGLAEVGLRAADERGDGAILAVGAGLRQQAGVRSVLDLGVRGDVAAKHGAARTPFALVAGYSTAF
jgi:hypothetical protein